MSYCTLFLIYLFIMSDTVHYIHTQAQAQAEIEHMRAINRMKYAHRQQHMREDPEYEARLRSTHSQTQKTIRNKKRKAIEDNPLFFFQAEDGIRDLYVTGVQTCALPI